MSTYARRKDTNQGEIVSALRAVGASVVVLHMPLDLLVGFRKRNYLIECKQARKKHWLSRDTGAQVKFAQTWNGQKAIVYTPQEAIDVITEAQ